ncbi:MAG: hypothetical protein IJO74_07075 [Clostridia bacterium]|nr:hypothetical protein [Clostridia bacterium]
MANTYKISNDPKGLMKKPPSYFFHGYDKKYGVPESDTADNVMIDESKTERQTKDIDNFIVEPAENEHEDTAVFGITSTPPQEVVMPEQSAESIYDEESVSNEKRSKRRNGKIRSTLQVDEDIRAMEDSDELNQDSDDDMKVVFGEVDHGAIDGLSDAEYNPYDTNDTEDDEEDQEEQFEIDEYTDPSKAEQFINYYRSSAKFSLLLTVCGIIVFLAMMYIESFSFNSSIPRPAFLDPTKMRLVLVLVDIQLLVISAALIYENFIDGFKAMFRGKPNSNTLSAVAMTVCALHSVAVYFTSTPETIMLYSSVGCLFGVFTLLKNYMESRRNLLTFKILSADGEKLVAEKRDKHEENLYELDEYLPEDPEIFSFKKAKFVDDAVRNINTAPESDRNFKIILPLVVIASIAFSIIIFVQSGDLNAAFNALAILCLAMLPVSSIMYITLPYLVESFRVFRKGCAMIGGNTFEEYSVADVVSFNDTVVFPSGGIKVNSVRTYGEHRIDHTIMYAARIFKTVGGPLAPVFENYIKNAVDDVQPVEIVSIEPDGIRTVIDGNDVYIGKKSFMLAYNFGFVKDSTDDAFENSVGRIMYMTVGDNIAAKFYIKYSIYRGFEKLLSRLTGVGVCVGIKSCDPNIDDALLTKLLRRKEYYVRIVKSTLPLPADEVYDNVSAGVVCKGNAFDLLRGILCCNKIAKNVSLNILTKFISVIVAFVMVIALSLIGGGCMPGVNALHICCYQLVWFMPVLFTAIFG